MGWGGACIADLCECTRAAEGGRVPRCMPCPRQPGSRVEELLRLRLHRLQELLLQPGRANGPCIERWSGRVPARQQPGAASCHPLRWHALTSLSPAARTTTAARATARGWYLCRGWEASQSMPCCPALVPQSFCMQAPLQAQRPACACSGDASSHSLAVRLVKDGGRDVDLQASRGARVGWESAAAAGRCLLVGGPASRPLPPPLLAASPHPPPTAGLPLPGLPTCPASSLRARMMRVASGALLPASRSARSIDSRVSPCSAPHMQAPKQQAAHPRLPAGCSLAGRHTPSQGARTATLRLDRSTRSAPA